MKPLLILVLSFMSLHILAQDNTKIVPAPKFDIDNAYPGGKDAWYKFLGKNFKYPDEAVNNEIQGTVKVQFVVDTAGNISDIKAISGPTKGGLREDAVRVIGLSGQWIPVTENGQKVKAYRVVPLTYKLQVSKL